MKNCAYCKAQLHGPVGYCPYCAQPVDGAPRAAPVPSVAPAPAVRPRQPPPTPVAAPARASAPAPAPVSAPGAAPVAPPRRAAQGPPPAPAAAPPSARRWLPWAAGVAALAAVAWLLSGNKEDAACNAAIDSGLALVANGSLDGARQKLATAQAACGGTSARLAQLQAAIGKTAAASAACQRAVRAIGRDLDSHRLLSAAQGLATLAAACDDTATVAALRRQLAHRQAAAAAVQAGVRQALDERAVATAQAGIARLESLDREYPDLPQLKADLRALASAASAGPAAVPAPPAPRRQSREPPASRVVESDTPRRMPELVAPAPSAGGNDAAARAEMAQSFVRDAERALLERKFDAAKTYLEGARRLDPGNAQIDSLSRQIRARERQVLQTETSIR